jgi:hypothetical protein
MSQSSLEGVVPFSELSADDIPWALTAAEPIDWLTMSDEDRNVEILRDGESYRQLALTALHHVHDLTRRLDREREAHHRTREELRRYVSAQMEIA